MREVGSNPILAAPSSAAASAPPDAWRAAIEAAHSVDELAAAAVHLRRLALESFAAGAGVLATTRLLSQINDLVTEWLVHRHARELGLDLRRACWLVFGSQGRSEQTLITDQDNGLVFDSESPAADRTRWLELGQRVNLALDVCGYRLCRGLVMAGQPDCCLTRSEWCDRFDRWMEHGAPKDLLNASIYFDLRGLVGQTDLVTPMRERIATRAAGLPRFIKQMADNALRNRVALTWFGSVRTTRHDAKPMFDLKLHGTALFVEAARLYALAAGVDRTGTAERLEAVAHSLHVPSQERQAWQRGFEILLRLRLQLQVQRATAPDDNPNRVAFDTLSESDRSLLERALHDARLLQQRVELDYQR